MEPIIDGMQYGRKVSLLLVEGEEALDLSAMSFRFKSVQQDDESPSSIAIRVYNLSDKTTVKVKGEYSRVVLQAGYAGSFGVIFDGTIRQLRFGREANGLDTYIDILAADGDLAYNFATVNKSLAAGTTHGDRLAVAVEAMTKNGVKQGQFLTPPTGGVLPRGKVLFGMAKAILRSETQNNGATWSMQNGKVNIIPLTGYLPGDAVVLNSLTGLIGRPEQTSEGLRCRCLLNPKITVGGLIKIDQATVNQTIQQKQGAPQLAYDKWAQLQALANITADGIYRVYVAEFTGDTRGRDFYMDLICLSVAPDTNQCKAYG